MPPAIFFYNGSVVLCVSHGKRSGMVFKSAVSCSSVSVLVFKSSGFGVQVLPKYAKLFAAVVRMQ